MQDIKVNNAHVIPKRKCINCGKEYTPKSVVQKYCTKTCGVSYRGIWGAWFPPTTFICAYCGEAVSTSGGRDHRTRFCCELCEKKFWKHGRSKARKQEKV